MRDGVSNHQPHDCLLNRYSRRRSKKTSELRVTGLRGIHRGPVNSPHKWPVTRKMFPFDDFIMKRHSKAWTVCMSSLPIYSPQWIHQSLLKYHLTSQARYYQSSLPAVFSDVCMIIDLPDKNLSNRGNQASYILHIQNTWAISQRIYMRWCSLVGGCEHPIWFDSIMNKVSETGYKS